MNRDYNRVVLHSVNGDLAKAISSAWDYTGLLKRVDASTRVALKPNFTYPFYKRGVTTSPVVIREAVKILRERTSHVSIVETDGGYGAWKVRDAFAGHGIDNLVREFGVKAVNLCDEPRESIQFVSRGKIHHLPLPSRLLHETDIFITLPVPKIHCMTGLSLAYKNQWGCIPDIMRLRRHYIFSDAIVAINQALKPEVLADGTYFLDETGPMEGTAVLMNLIIAATNAGSFDRYVSELMGYPWKKVLHLRRAVAAGDMPARLEEIRFNISPFQARTHTFRLKRTFRNYIALTGFKSRFITWLGYESWFGRVVLHTILYAIAGKPVKPGPASES